MINVIPIARRIIKEYCFECQLDSTSPSLSLSLARALALSLSRALALSLARSLSAHGTISNFEALAHGAK